MSSCLCNTRGLRQQQLQTSSFYPISCIISNNTYVNIYFTKCFCYSIESVWVVVCCKFCVGLRIHLPLPFLFPSFPRCHLPVVQGQVSFVKNFLVNILNITIIQHFQKKHVHFVNTSVLTSIGGVRSLFQLLSVSALLQLLKLT
jgi:hypothetical protein